MARAVYSQPTTLPALADAFAMKLPQGALPEVMQAITGGAQAIAAAQAEAVPDASLPPSKNVPSPAE